MCYSSPVHTWTLCQISPIFYFSGEKKEGNISALYSNISSKQHFQYSIFSFQHQITYKKYHFFFNNQETARYCRKNQKHHKNNQTSEFSSFQMTYISMKLPNMSIFNIKPVQKSMTTYSCLSTTSFNFIFQDSCMLPAFNSLQFLLGLCIGYITHSFTSK